MDFDYKQSPEAFFNAYHEKYTNENDLINPNWKLYQTKYHYNMVENGILDLLKLNFGEDILDKSILDVGAGTGHWIDFYNTYLNPLHIKGVDFSYIVVSRLFNKYKDNLNITINQLDISKKEDSFVDYFDIINAVGVMFHLIDDIAWGSAVSNLCSYLKKDGVAIIGGDFGDYTHTISHHRKVRSLNVWRDVLAYNDCTIIDTKIFKQFDKDSRDLRNNLLAFRRI
jgi:SAM-dependent methyltransferase